MTNNNRSVHFQNGLELEVIVEGNRFLGIGELRYQGTPLRSGALPWTVYTESELGLRFDTFCLKEIKQDADAVTIEFTGGGQWLPRIQDADAMGDARFKTRRLRNPTATFRWTFRAIEERIEENVWTGIAMKLSIFEPRRPDPLAIGRHDLGDRWRCCRLHIDTAGCLDHRLRTGSCRGERVQHHRAIFTDDADAWGGSFPMDMLPRAAGSAICDFQTKGDLAICIFAERPGLTRARVEKFDDELVIHYSDRSFFPLSTSVQSPERKLIVYRHHAPLARHERRNFVAGLLL